MTAPAPRNHPAEGAHPAPTPAPVAVPEGGWRDGDALVLIDAFDSPMLFRRGWDTWAGDYSIVRTDEQMGRSNIAYIHAPREDAAPEPVVAPLPSEAGALVLATIGSRTIPLELQATGVWLSPGRHGSYIAADIDSWVRLVPEDDEDTVRVPGDAVLNALARLTHEVMESTHRSGASTEAALADVKVVEDALGMHAEHGVQLPSNEDTVVVRPNVRATTDPEGWPIR